MLPITPNPQVPRLSQ